MSFLSPHFLDMPLCDTFRHDHHQRNPNWETTAEDTRHETEFNAQDSSDLLVVFFCCWMGLSDTFSNDETQIGNNC